MDLKKKMHMQLNFEPLSIIFYWLGIQKNENSVHFIPTWKEKPSFLENAKAPTLQPLLSTL
jgi:hypothetical protein